MSAVLKSAVAQELYFPKIKFSRQAAKQWAKDKGYTVSTVIDDGDQWKIVIDEPANYSRLFSRDLGSVLATVGFKKGYGFSEPRFASSYLEESDLEEVDAWAANRIPIACFAVPPGQRAFLSKMGSDCYLDIMKGPGMKIEDPDMIKSCDSVMKDFVLDGFYDGKVFKAIDCIYMGEDIWALPYIERKQAMDMNIWGTEGSCLLVVPCRFALSASEFKSVLKAVSSNTAQYIMCKGAWGPYSEEDADSYLISKAVGIDAMVVMGDMASGYTLGCKTENGIHELGLAQSDKQLSQGQVVRVSASGYDAVYSEFSGLKILGSGQSCMTLQDVKVKSASLVLAKSIGILKADLEKQIVYGVVLEPDSVDLQGDVISAEEIEKTAHKFMRESRVIGFGHKSREDGATPVESWVAIKDFTLGDSTVKKGSWCMGVYVPSPDTWQGIKNGEINSFSIGGFGLRETLE